jgi:hypothetical protein
VLSVCRVPLQDVSNISDRRVKKSCSQSRVADSEEDCSEIESPVGFGLFDLGINRDINERSLLFQQLRSNVKVSLVFIPLFCEVLLFFYCSLESKLVLLTICAVPMQVEDSDAASPKNVLPLTLEI